LASIKVFQKAGRKEGDILFQNHFSGNQLAISTQDQWEKGKTWHLVPISTEGGLLQTVCSDIKLKDNLRPIPPLYANIPIQLLG